MRVFDMHHGIVTRRAVAFTDNGGAAAPASPVIIDTAGYESLEFIICTGTITVGGAVTLDHGDASDLSDSAAVGSEETLGSITLTATDDDRSFKIGYIGKRRYVRLNFATAIRTGLTAVAVLGTAHTQPTPDTSGV